MANNRLHQVRRFQKIAGLLKEDNDLDLSDTPEFINFRSRIKSALGNAGVDFNRPIWVERLEGRARVRPRETSVGEFLDQVVPEVQEFFADEGEDTLLFVDDLADYTNPIRVSGKKGLLPPLLLVSFSYSIEYVIYQSRRLREDDDLDLSDTPQFDSLASQIKSNLKRAGVDISRPFWVNRDSEEGEDGGFGGMRLTDIDDFIKEVEEFVTGYIGVDLSDAQIEYDIDDDVSDAIRARRRRRAYPIITVSVKGPDPNSIADRFHVFQGEDLSENDDLDLSDTPEFQVNYENDLGFIEWLGEREIEDIVVGADHDYDIYNIGMRVLDDYEEKDPGLLKRIYKNYLKYKKRYGIK